MVKLPRLLVLVIVSLITIGLLAAVAGNAAAATYTMVIAHHFPEDLTNNEVHPALMRFKDLVELHTNGDIKVEVHGALTLGTEVEYTREARSGIAVQSAVLSSGALSSFFKPYQIMTTPFLFPNYPTAWAFFDSQWFAEFMDDMRKETGLRYLGTFDDGGGFVAFTNSKKLIKSPEDLSGLKIRVEENPAHIALMEALGAQAVPLEWGQVQAALATGVADGQFNAPGLNAAMKFWELVPYSTWSGHVYNTLTWVVNDAWFNKLPENHRRAILWAAREAVALGHGIAAHLTLQGWEEGCRRFKECYMLSAEEQEAFREKARPEFYRWITDEFGMEPEFVQEVWDKVDEVRQDLDDEFWGKYGH